MPIAIENDRLKELFKPNFDIHNYVDGEELITLTMKQPHDTTLSLTIWTTNPKPTPINATAEMILISLSVEDQLIDDFDLYFIDELNPTELVGSDIKTLRHQLYARLRGISLDYQLTGELPPEKV